MVACYTLGLVEGSVQDRLVACLFPSLSALPWSIFQAISHFSFSFFLFFSPGFGITGCCDLPTELSVTMIDAQLSKNCGIGIGFLAALREDTVIVNPFSPLLGAQIHLQQPLPWSCTSCLVNQKAPGRRRSLVIIFKRPRPRRIQR